MSENDLQIIATAIVLGVFALVVLSFWGGLLVGRAIERPPQRERRRP